MVDQKVATVKQPFIEHVRELRRSLAICIIAILLGSGVGYALADTLLALLQAPLGQKLYYTSPTGAFSFIIKLCLSFGVIVSLPIIVHQAICFLSPLMHSVTKRHVATMTIWSLLLAVGGIMFTYFVSLPGALHFLTNFHTDSIESMITADAYFTFVITYLFGAALLFQLPLLMFIINKVKPLRPRTLLSIERYVFVASFILAAIITPTPDPLNLIIMAVPIILMYQAGVILIWLVNRRMVKQIKKRGKRVGNVSRTPQTHVADLQDEDFVPTALPTSQTPVVPVLKPAPIVRHQQPTAAQRQATMPRNANTVKYRVNGVQPNSRLIRDIG